MGFTLNKITLIGNLGRDAETRFTTTGVSVTNFSLATTFSYKKNDEWIEETTWHNITSFNLSEYYRKGLKKGAKVYVEGRLTKREYTDKEGVKRYSTDIISNDIILLSSNVKEDFNEEAPGDAPEPDAKELTYDNYMQNKTTDDLPF